MTYPSAVGFYNYGNTQNFLAWIVLRPLHLAGLEVTFATASLVIVLWQLVFIALAYLALIRIVSKLELTLGIGLLLISIPAASQGVFLWSYQIHPDVLQFSLCMIFVTLFLDATPNLLAAGLILGLAIGTKWQSALFLIFFMLVISKMPRKEGRSPNLWKAVLVFVVALGGAFAATNLSFFLEVSEAVRDIRFEGWHVWYGHGARAGGSFVDWIPIFFRESLGLVVAAPMLFFLSRKLQNATSSPILDFLPGRGRVLGGAAMITLSIGVVQLLAAVNYREPRYFIYLLPLIVIIAATSAAEIGGNHPGKARWYELVALAVFPMYLFSVFSNVAISQERTQEFYAREQFEAGAVVESACSPGAPALLPMYSYLPAEFTNIVGDSFWIFNQADLEEASIVVLNRQIPGMHLWPEIDDRGNRTLVLGELDESPGQISVFSKLLSDPESVGFSIIFDGDDVKAYVRDDSGACDFAASQVAF